MSGENSDQRTQLNMTLKLLGLLPKINRKERIARWLFDLGSVAPHNLESVVVMDPIPSETSSVASFLDISEMYPSESGNSLTLAIA